MFETFRTWYKLNVASLLLLTLYVSEAYSKVLQHFFASTTLIPRTIKFILLIVVVVGICYKKPKLLILPFCLSIMFVIGQFYLANGFNNDIIIVFGRFLYPILFLIFMNIFPLSVNQRNRVFVVLERLMLFNSILVLIGFVFEVSLFKTYGGSRFGYNGLIITSATGSYVYILYLIFLFAKYKENFFKIFSNYIVLLSCFIVGTKALYLFIFGFAIVWVFNKYKGKKMYIWLCSITALLGILSYIFFFRFGVFYEIQKTKGLFTALMSYRDQLFLENTWPFIKSNWEPINYLFGGISDIQSKSQIDFIDILYFFGIIGGAIYLLAYYKSFITFRPKFSIILLFCLLLFIVFLAGNFFSYSSIVIYLVILREFLVHGYKKPQI